MGTTGLRQSERIAALMAPDPAKSDEDLADAIDAWEREERDLCYGDESMKMTDPWTTTALKALLPQRIKDRVEMDSARFENYQDVRHEAMQLAMHRGLPEIVQGATYPNNMDTSHVSVQEDWGWTAAANLAATTGPTTANQGPWASTWWWSEPDAAPEARGGCIGQRQRTRERKGQRKRVSLWKGLRS